LFIGKLEKKILFGKKQKQTKKQLWLPEPHCKIW